MHSPRIQCDTVSLSSFTTFALARLSAISQLEELQLLFTTIDRECTFNRPVLCGYVSCVLCIPGRGEITYEQLASVYYTSRHALLSSLRSVFSVVDMDGDGKVTCMDLQTQLGE